MNLIDYRSPLKNTSVLRFFTKKSPIELGRGIAYDDVLNV